MKNKDKIIYIEVLRIIAILFVIFNHTAIDGYFLFSLKSPHHMPYWIYAFISVFCKFAVPVFFMITGSIYLRRDNISFKELFFKRILKMVIIAIVFSLLYYCYNLHLYNLEFNFLSFLKDLISCNISVHFWYLYMYIAFLISIPFLKMISNQMNTIIFNYLIALVLFFNGIVPCINFLLFKEELSYCYMLTPIWFVNIIFIYPLIGYYLDNKLTINKPKKKLLILWIVNILLIIFTNYMTYYHSTIIGKINEAVSQPFYNCFVIINAITIYLTIRELFNKEHKLVLLISKLGKYTFGVYLIHMLIKKHTLYQQYLTQIKELNLNSGLVALYMTFSIYLISLIITFALSKIPLIKKLVGF